MTFCFLFASFLSCHLVKVYLNISMRHLLWIRSQNDQIRFYFCSKIKFCFSINYIKIFLGIQVNAVSSNLSFHFVSDPSLYFGVIVPFDIDKILTDGFFITTFFLPFSFIKANFLNTCLYVLTTTKV